MTTDMSAAALARQALGRRMVYEAHEAHKQTCHCMTCSNTRWVLHTLRMRLRNGGE